MLVIARKFNESIIIGDDIKITILENTNGNQIKIGIDAPIEIEVHREEVFQEIKADDEIWDNRS